MKDYSNHIIPVALALVLVENYDNWVWFLKVVRDELGEMRKTTVLSDRQKGLVAAVKTVFPESDHRYCLCHIMDNISRGHTSLTAEDRGLICQIVRSDCENDFNLLYGRLRKSKPKAVSYLDTVDTQHWVKFRFQNLYDLPTFSEITSNMSEQANNWLGNDLRSSKPLDAFNLFCTTNIGCRSVTFVTRTRPPSSPTQPTSTWTTTRHCSSQRSTLNTKRKASAD